MISPDEYMSRLKMPAMTTDLHGNIIFANFAMKRLEPVRCRKVVLRCPGGGREECSGTAVTLCTGIGNRRMLVLFRGDTARFYLTRIFARRTTAAVSDGDLPFVIKTAGFAERKMLDDPGTSPGSLIGEAAYSAFSGLYARKLLTVHDFCRFLGLSTAVLFGSSRVEYREGFGKGITLVSPERAFFAAGEMIAQLAASPGIRWRVLSGGGQLTLTDGIKRICAGECSAVPRTHSGQFSLSRGEVLVSAAAAAADFAFFRKPVTAAGRGRAAEYG